MVALQSVDTISTQKLLRKVVDNMTTNSLLNPADSLTPILHFPNRDGSCYYCNETITFVAGLNRYVGNSGIRCKEAK
jgi:hypothetical protein